MNVVILEDEKLNADHLTTLLHKLDPGIRVLAVYDSVRKSAEAFQKGLVADLLFMDIHLADGSGFELFSRVKLELPVIFTTAYDEYALQAFKVNSIDYLLKPIGLDDLQVALDKFRKLGRAQIQTPVLNHQDVYQRIAREYKSRFIVKMGDTLASVKTEEIDFFIAEDGLVILSAKSGKRFPIDHTLDVLETLLSPDLFFRINRKVLVNINSIQKISSYFNSRLKIVCSNLQNDDCIVSRERVGAFKEWLDR
ncbi:MAG TPA: LytTR family DNA-binding domain-containing protein [Bacteroidia bacterium]|jgi:DNA-binding LytR/AlgR family response regulator|nr:LytTR family DNA-binding domain-containing protein [Bacteroidia bacterium]